MLSNEEARYKLKNIDHRHNQLKDFFNGFQVAIENFENHTWVRGAVAETLSSVKSVLTYIDRKYELRFSTHYSGGALIGKITAYRIVEGEAKELTSVVYKGTSELDIKVPHGEDPMRLDHEFYCTQLVLNWIWDDINESQPSQ